MSEESVPGNRSTKSWSSGVRLASEAAVSCCLCLMCRQSGDPKASVTDLGVRRAPEALEQKNPSWHEQPGDAFYNQSRSRFYNRDTTLVLGAYFSIPGARPTGSSSSGECSSMSPSSCRRQPGACGRVASREARSAATHVDNFPVLELDGVELGSQCMHGTAREGGDSRSNPAPGRGGGNLCARSRAARSGRWCRCACRGRCTRTRRSPRVSGRR